MQYSQATMRRAETSTIGRNVLPATAHSPAKTIRNADPKISN